jgi:hypothetical protein
VPAGGTSAANYQEREIRHVLVLGAALRQASDLSGMQDTAIGTPTPDLQAWNVKSDPACVRAPITQLDLDKEGITSVIWATGYTFDFSWIHLPVLDGSGKPKHLDGVTDVPGLYFLGLPWLSKMNSSFLSAAAVAEHIAGNRRCATMSARQ